MHAMVRQRNKHRTFHSLFTYFSNHEFLSQPITGKGGKFSGGFDISSFSDVQGGQSMIYLSSQFMYDQTAVLITILSLLLFFAVMQPKVGYIAIDILTDTVEGIWSFHLSQLAIGLKWRIVLTFFLCIIVETAATKPSVAAIDGLALGGGLEVAMVLSVFILVSFSYISYSSVITLVEI
jgi:hypothetical protein